MAFHPLFCRILATYRGYVRCRLVLPSLQKIAVSVPAGDFGSRYAYYVNGINRTVISDAAIPLRSLFAASWQ